MIKPFETIVFQLFLDLLRASGMALNAKQIDQLRSSSQNFSSSFKAEAQLACLNFLKEFQDNVKETVDSLEARVVKLEIGGPISFGSNAKPVIVKPLGEKLTPEDFGLSKGVDKSEKKADN